MRVFFGGTFDPVHVGHVHAAEASRRALDVPIVELVLGARPAHRRAPAASSYDRYRMLSIALATSPGLRPNDTELQLVGSSFTVVTAAALRAADRPLVCVTGSDSYATLEQWYQWQRLPSLCHLLVLRRPGAAVAAPPPGFELASEVGQLRESPAGLVHVIDDGMLDVSATQIRAAIKRGQMPTHLLPQGVSTYITERDLYV